MSGPCFRLRINGQEVRASCFSLSGPERQMIDTSLIDAPRDRPPILGTPGAQIEIQSFYSELRPFFGQAEVSVEIESVEDQTTRKWPRCRIEKHAFELPGGSTPAELFLTVMP